mmetsp:Transcript_20011/g.62915  ORF Transcript_20011/g.62915 Transcript_20011/m.62915 type:complete len:217 (+) Transcript_20011:66-716(+)
MIASAALLVSVVARGALGLSPCTPSDVLTRRSACSSLLGAGLLAAGGRQAAARPEGVNKPELLPSRRPDGSTPKVIDAGVGFLTKGEMKRLETLIADLEKETGYKVRVLCQRYPETPGLAIKDYWGVDDNTVVLVADKGLKGTSNILNFNVGDAFADTLPNIFWQRLQGRYGTSRYWREKGEDVSIMNAVESIVFCAKSGCVDPPAESVLTPKLGI